MSHTLFGARGIAQIADVALGIPLAAAAFYATARALHIAELNETRDALLAKLPARWRAKNATEVASTGDTIC
jgi:hypothetical protein